MKKYASLDSLKNEFLAGDFDFDTKTFALGDVEFQFLGETSKYSLLDIMRKNHKPLLVYNLVANKENEEKAGDLKRWIVFLWGMNDKAQLVPYDVRNLNKARANVPIKEAPQDGADDRVIADKVEVRFIDLPVANNLVAKVDTGAQVTSLHATDIQINRSTEGNTVSFNAPDLSQNRFTLPLQDQQAVKTSNGDTTNRPVIKVNMKIKNKLLKDILVNLNDRSTMDDPLLLGQNALEAGNFIVDPNLLKDDINFDPEFLAELQQEVVPSTRVSDEEARELYEALTKIGNLSITDIVKILRTEIVNEIDDISY